MVESCVLTQMLASDWLLGPTVLNRTALQGAGNYTRVMDLYKYDNVAGYPCFDHTYGCSVDNATIGTIDAEDASSDAYSLSDSLIY